MADFPQSAALIRDRAAQRVKELAVSIALSYPPIGMHVPAYRIARHSKWIRHGYLLLCHSLYLSPGKQDYVRVLLQITRKIWFQDEDEQDLDPADGGDSSVQEEEPDGGSTGDGEVQTCKAEGDGSDCGGGAADSGTGGEDGGLACPNSSVGGRDGPAAPRKKDSSSVQAIRGSGRRGDSSGPDRGAGAGGSGQESCGGGNGAAGVAGSPAAFGGGPEARVQQMDRQRAGCAGRGDSVDEVRSAGPAATIPLRSPPGEDRPGGMASQHDSGPAAQRPLPERPDSMQQPAQGAAPPGTPGTSRHQSLDEQRPPSRVYWRSVDMPRPNDVLQLTPREERDALTPPASLQPPATTPHPPQCGTSGAAAPPSSQQPSNAASTAHWEGSPGPAPVPIGPAGDWPWATAGSDADSAANSRAPAVPPLSRRQNDDAPTGRGSLDSTRDMLVGQSAESPGRPESRRDAYRKHWRSIDVARPTDVLQLTPRGGHDAGAAGPAGTTTDAQPRPPSRQQQLQQEQLQQQQHRDAAIPPTDVFNSSLYAPATATAQPAAAAASESKASSLSFRLGSLQVRPPSSGNAGNPRRAPSQQATLPGPVCEATLDRASATGHATLSSTQPPRRNEAPYIPAGIAAAIAAAAAVPLGEALDRGAGEETDLDALTSRQVQGMRSGNTSRNRTAQERRASSALYDQHLGSAATLPHPPTRTSTTGGMLRTTEQGLLQQQHSRATATGSSVHGDHHHHPRATATGSCVHGDHHHHPRPTATGSSVHGDHHQHSPSGTGYARRASRRASVMISHWYMEQLERDAPLEDSGELMGGGGGSTQQGRSRRRCISSLGPGGRGAGAPCQPCLWQRLQCSL